MPTAVTAPPPLTLTGERTLPGIADENYWFRRHEAAYRWLAPFARGATVLEAGCGEGYGAALLAEASDRVVGLDYDPAAAAHVRRRYPQIGVARANLVQLPLADGSVEVVATLQVLEHLWEQPRFVDECARVLRPAGTLLLTTPNRLTFPPGNLFHTTELTGAELAALLAPRFDVTRLLGLRHGPRLRRWERRHGSIVSAQLAVPPGDWPPRLRQRVHATTADDFEVTADVDAALDLVAVGIRRP